MGYKVNDLVYFDLGLHKGVGKIVATKGRNAPYLVHSTQIVNGHDGMNNVHKQDNKNNWWFSEKHLKPFTKQVGQRYKVISNEFISFGIGDIVILAELSDDKTSDYESECGEYRNYMYDLDHRKCEVEFYADVEDAKEQKENEMFTKDDLKSGYLVKLRNEQIAHIVNTIDEGMCLNFENTWATLRAYDNDLTNATLNECDVVEVYGLTKKGYNAHKFETNKRELLWERDAAQEMTIEDIQKALGYKIKVIV